MEGRWRRLSAWRSGKEGSAPWVGAVDERPPREGGEGGARRELAQDEDPSAHCGVQGRKCRSGRTVEGKYVEGGMGTPSWEFGGQDVKAIRKAVG